MRKNIIGITNEEEDDYLFNWLDEDEDRFNFYTWFILYVNSNDDLELMKKLTRHSPNNNTTYMKPTELNFLLQQYWTEIRRRDDLEMNR